MIFSQLERQALTVLGGFHPDQDNWLNGFKTALLIAPKEPDFWDHFTAQPEYQDGQADPLDRFSKRVLNALAQDVDGRAIFPSDGPPYPPFIHWATLAGCHISPVNLLVHEKTGLFASFRGLLAVRERLDLPKHPTSPCDSCALQPCRSACPVGAMTDTGYDVAACKNHVQSDAGSACLSGCRVRLSCPNSQSFGRVAEQSEFHMKAFLRP